MVINMSEDEIRARVDAMQENVKKLETSVESIERLISQIKWVMIGAIGLFTLETLGIKVIVREIFK